MEALFYRYNAIQDMWVHEPEREGVACTAFQWPDCKNSQSYQYPKPAHRAPDGHVWDATSGLWVPDPDAEPKAPKGVPPAPPGRGASEEDRRDWLRRFSEYDGREWPWGEYRSAYKKATRASMRMISPMRARTKTLSGSMSRSTPSSARLRALIVTI